MLRDIDSGSLGHLFVRGIQDNVSRADYTQLLVEINRMSQIFSEHKTLQPGESFSIDWVPGSGTVVTVKGAIQGEPFKDPAFFQAMMAIWLGERPADW